MAVTCYITGIYLFFIMSNNYLSIVDAIVRLPDCTFSGGKFLNSVVIMSELNFEGTFGSLILEETTSFFSKQFKEH